MKRIPLTGAFLSLATVLLLISLSYLFFLEQGIFFTEREEGPFEEELPFRREVAQASLLYGVEEARIYAVIRTESDFRADAVSSAGAVGLMQMLPSTYEEQCMLKGVPYDPEDLKQPQVNIDFCTSYLQYLYNLTGSWRNAHIAYHAGIGTLLGWLENEKYSADGRYLDVIPKSSTAEYMRRIDAAYREYRQILERGSAEAVEKS